MSAGLSSVLLQNICTVSTKTLNLVVKYVFLKFKMDQYNTVTQNSNNRNFTTPGASKESVLKKLLET